VTLYYSQRRYRGMIALTAWIAFVIGVVTGLFAGGGK
jgi:hypothetical protein